jgi:hypothetical protein
LNNDPKNIDKFLLADVVSSKLVDRLSYQKAGSKEILRDVSWHPYEPSLVSAGFDGALVEWGYDTQACPLSLSVIF